MFITVIVFILILGLLVFVHEFGHFWAAKKSGVSVHEFAFGFRPRLFAWRRGETEYAINLLPLGGYVRLEGESEDSGQKGSFSGKSPGVRAKILVAGVVMNAILAWVLITASYMIGSFPLTSSYGQHAHLEVEPHVMLGLVLQGSPADVAGLKVGDLITVVNNVPITSVGQLVEDLKKQAGNEITIGYDRDGNPGEVRVTPRANPPEGQGALGVGPQEVSNVRAAWYWAPVVGAQEVGSQIVQSFTGFMSFVGNLLTQQEVSEDVSGLVGVGALTGVVRRLGVGPLLQFIAIISTNLAVINLLPILPLDGGHLLFVGLEAIRRKPVLEKYRQWVALAGLTAILLLFVVVTYKDVVRFEVIDRLFGWL